MKRLSIALYGGSFDPIHEGHIQTACFLQQYFKFSQFIFLPCGSPALKPKCVASNVDRLAMLQLALADYPEFKIDTRELERPKTTYTIDTLKEYRHEYGDKVSIAMIIGQDAFAQLMDWHQWQDLLNYAHIINHQRPHQALVYPPKLQTYVEAHLTQSQQELLTTPHGKIFCLHAGDYPYASTQIRHSIEQHTIPQGLNPKVLAYIQAHELYLQP